MDSVVGTWCVTYWDL